MAEGKELTDAVNRLNEFVGVLISKYKISFQDEITLVELGQDIINEALRN